MTTPRPSIPGSQADAPLEPTDTSSIMYRAPASNWLVLSLTILSLVATVAVLYFVVRGWDAATVHAPPLAAQDTSLAAAGDSLAGSTEAGGLQYPSEQTVLLMIILMGALGGLVHLSSSLAKYVGNRQLLRSWIIYYLLIPFEGAALAPMVYLLLRAGVLAAPQEGTASTSGLNVVVLYGFAGLTGLFSKQAIEMLADVFATIFKRVRARDSIAQAESPGGQGRDSAAP